MKMAENVMLTFNNNCATNNRNCAEVDQNPIINENIHVTDTINIKNSQNEKLLNSSDICTQEEAEEELLAGENKIKLENDEHSLEASDEHLENKALEKSDNGGDCEVEEYEDLPAEACEDEESSKLLYEDQDDSANCLSKMQIMEDVREGCNIQPSSPGHADQRSIDTKVNTEVKEENTSDETIETTSDRAQTNEEIKGDNEPIESEMIEPKEENIEENYSNASSPSTENNKRKLDTDELPVKRLRSEIHENFNSRDKILNEFIEMADCNNLEQIHTFSEQLLAEVRTLNELAKEKEREWNNIIHLKKLKEELLLRMQRKRQLLILNEKSDYLECLGESQIENFEDRTKNCHPQSILKMNLASKHSLRIPNININGDRSKQRNIFPRCSQYPVELNGSLDYRNKQRPTLDVQSIIADYRQRHPETVPRRGRRIRPNSDGIKSSGNVLNFASVTLGSGSQVRQNVCAGDINNELGHLLNTVNMNGAESIKLSNADSSNTSDHDTVSFKDMLQQFAKLSQSERNELLQNAIKPPPPYPEVTVHPVPTTSATPTNSLLHGILTKTPTKQSKTSFSPTLARLLTAPERSTPHATSSPILPNSTTIHPSNMSISEILSTSKTRNEITITPVDAQYESTPIKGRSNDEDETEDSADRLVIDESNEIIDARKNTNTDSNSDTGDEIPQCQGCNQKPAQFVCAGCGNQWYCSRDCQVSAWDEHSEVCSG